MIALFLLPLLLVFGLFDFGGSDDGSDSADGTGADLPEDAASIDVLGLLDVEELSSGDDTFFGTSGLDEVNGGDGDDRLLGFGGTDYLDGGSGDDVLRGGDGHDVLGGEDGEDYIVGGAGSDLVFGGSGDDSLVGQDGNDLMYGGSGSDTVSGGDGHDILYSFHNNGPDPAADDALLPAYNVEHINAFDALAYARPDLTAEQIEGILSAQGIGEEDLPVAPADGQVDYLSGEAGNDILFLGAGDEGDGGAGQDSFVVTSGNAGGAAAIVHDYDAGDDVVVVNYVGPSEPVITINVNGADAEVLADGEMLAQVVGAATTLDAADVRLVATT